MENAALELLILDDNTLIADTLSKKLQKNFGTKINVLTFFDADHCLRNIGGQSHVIIIDYFIDSDNKGFRNGLTIFNYIKKSNPQAEVTMITSNKGISIAREEIEFTVCKYIMKNVTHSNELLNQFNKVIISPIKTNIVSPIKTSVAFPIQKIQNYYLTKNYMMLALITSISISILVAVGYLNSIFFH